MLDSEKNPEKARHKFMKNAMLNNPVLQPGYWVPNNINEFFFYDEDGILSINSEMVKSLYIEYASILKGAFQNFQKKYDSTINNILQDNDLENVDFPIVMEKVKVDGLSALLTPELRKKLGLENDPFDLSTTDMEK